MNLRIILVNIVLQWFVITAYAQHDINIEISKYPDTLLLLTSYYGDKVVLVDTAYSKQAGKFKFKGENDLPPGIYMAVSENKTKLFEFVVDDQQKFSLSTDTVSYSKNMIIKGSDENEVFFNYIKLNEKNAKTLNKLYEKLKLLNPSDEEYLNNKAKLDSINDVLAEFKMEIIKEKPDFLVSKIFKAMQVIEVPDSVRLSSEANAAYYYYRKHYFDNTDISDARLLRTPLLANTVNKYFKELVVKQPDSTIAAIDLVIAKARPSEEVVSYLVWNFTSEYQNPEYMGFEKVFVHMVDTYFSKEQIENTTPSVLKNLQDRANRIRPSMIGEIAPNLILLDTTGNYISFQNLQNDYVILFFWDYDCGICKKDIVELQKIYKQTDFDFEVYSINVNADLNEWKETIVDRKLKWINVNGTRSISPDFHDLYDISGTPVIFILDKQQKIIARQLAANQVLPFLEGYSKTIENE